MYQSQSSKYLDLLQPLGLFRLAQAKEVGVPQSSLSWLVSKGEITKIGPDAYHHKDIHIDPQDVDFAVACLVFGDKATIGGASALFFYNLIEQIPNQIWVLVSPNTTTHNKMFKLIRTKTSLEVGIDTHEWFRITSIERTIVDAFRFQTKLGGIEMALKAARIAIKEKQVTSRGLLNAANELNWSRQFLNYWEAITID